MNHEQEKPQEQPAMPNDRESSKPSSGGSVIVGKVNESSRGVLDAYNACITPQTKIPRKLQEYPNAREEKERLIASRQLIEDTQAQLEGPPKDLHQKFVYQRPDLETIPEVSSSSEPREQWQEPVLRERSRDTETRIDGPPKPTQLESVFRRTDLETIPEVASTLEREESIGESFVLKQVVPYAKMQKPNHQEPIIEEPNIQEFLQKQNAKKPKMFSSERTKVLKNVFFLTNQSA